MQASKDNRRPAMDEITQQIAHYVFEATIESKKAFETAQLCLADAIGCAILARKSKVCDHLLGPWVTGETVAKGPRALGSDLSLEPMKAAFDNTLLIRWQDYNDTWLAAEWGHPSDNIGALLSAMDFVNQRPDSFNQKQYTVRDLLEAMIKAYEIQGILALSNSFNAEGIDHVVLVKLASTALVTKILGGDKAQIEAAITQVWVDGQSLRTYRHAPNTGSRKSWAAADAVSRAIRLATITLQGEPGYPSALTAPNWGMDSVILKDNPLSLTQPLASYVIENVLFKIAYPAEFHAQTAIECATKLFPWLQDKLQEIATIEIDTHEAALRIIDKTGPLHSPADRDHALQYMVAIALMTGNVTVEDYYPPRCDDPEIDRLRTLMHVKEDQKFSKDYHDPKQRAIANRVTVRLKNGEERTETCHFPLGHPQRREEGIPLLWKKFEENVAGFYAKDQAKKLQEGLQSDLMQTQSVSELLEMCGKT